MEIEALESVDLIAHFQVLESWPRIFLSPGQQMKEERSVITSRKGSSGALLAFHIGPGFIGLMNIPMQIDGHLVAIKRIHLPARNKGHIRHGNT